MLQYFIEASYYEKEGNYDKAIKAVEKGYTSKDIGMFTKGFMLEKLEDLKRKRAGQ